MALTKHQKGQYKREVRELKEEFDRLTREINDFKENLFDVPEKENGETLSVTLNNEIESLNQKKRELSKLYDSVYKPNNNTGRIFADRIDNFIVAFKKKEEEIQSIKENINEAQDEINGYENKSGEFEPGIKQRLNELYTEQKEKQNEMFSKIEGLLKGAGTVALSKAFKEHKDSFKSMNIVWLIVFGVSLMAMMLLTYKSVDALIGMEFTDVWKVTIGNLPFIVAIVWIAIYASKQRSQNKRLQQEYAYKEDVAKIYYGLKKEIEEMSESDLSKKLNQNVLDVLVATVGTNPNHTLESNSHNDNGPLGTLANSLGNKVNSKKK